MEDDFRPPTDSLKDDGVLVVVANDHKPGNPERPIVVEHAPQPVEHRSASFG